MEELRADSSPNIPGCPPRRCTSTTSSDCWSATGRSCLTRVDRFRGQSFDSSEGTIEIILHSEVAHGCLNVMLTGALNGASPSTGTTSPRPLTSVLLVAPPTSRVPAALRRGPRCPVRYHLDHASSRHHGCKPTFNEHPTHTGCSVAATSHVGSLFPSGSTSSTHRNRRLRAASRRMWQLKSLCVKSFCDRPWEFRRFIVFDDLSNPRCRSVVSTGTGLRPGGVARGVLRRQLLLHGTGSG